jgi:type I restriction enzyme S subunit
MNNQNNNNLPKGWRKVKLGEILKEPPQYGYTASATNKKAGPKFLRVTDIVGYKVDWTRVPFCKISEKEKKKYLLNKGDIVFARAGTVGYTFFVKENPPEDTIFASYLIRIKIDEKRYDPVYVSYFLKSPLYWGQVNSFLTGTSQPGINATSLKDFELLIPEDPNEQKRIADILSAFDDKIEVNNKIIKTLEEMAQEIFKEWFVRFRFPGWQKVKFVDSELGKIPEGWKATILEEIMNLRREKFKYYNEWKNEKLLDLGRFPQKSLAINEHGKGEEIKTSAFKFYKGDILFGAVRPYFHKVVIAPFDGVTNQSVFVIFPKKQEFYSYLITILFSESTINYATNMASGTKMPVLKYEDLANMNIVLPDFKILSIFNEIVDKFYKILIEKVEENQKLVALRDLLLPKLMSGEIRV